MGVERISGQIIMSACCCVRVEKVMWIVQMSVLLRVTVSALMVVLMGVLMNVSDFFSGRAGHCYVINVSDCFAGHLGDCDDCDDISTDELRSTRCGKMSVGRDG